MLARPTLTLKNRRTLSVRLSASSKPSASSLSPPAPAPASTMATTGVSAFLSQHDLQAKIEDALNRCVKSKPDEPLSFLVRFPFWGCSALLCSPLQIVLSAPMGRRPRTNARAGFSGTRAINVAAPWGGLGAQGSRLGAQTNTRFLFWVPNPGVSSPSLSFRARLPPATRGRDAPHADQYKRP